MQVLKEANIQQVTLCMFNLKSQVAQLENTWKSFSSSLPKENTIIQFDVGAEFAPPDGSSFSLFSSSQPEILTTVLDIHNDISISLAYANHDRSNLTSYQHWVYTNYELYVLVHYHLSNSL